MPVLFLAIAFISGACAMVIEIGGARMISGQLGGSVYVWASTIGFVLMSLSAGYYIGGKAAARDTFPLWPVLALAAISTALLPALGGQVLPLTGGSGIAMASAVAGLILVPSGVLYGMVSPMIIGRLKGRLGEGAAGTVFGVSTVGSISGVILTGLVMVRFLPVSLIFLCATALMAAAAAASYMGGKG